MPFSDLENHSRLRIIPATEKKRYHIVYMIHITTLGIIMAKYVCSSSLRNAWQLPPGEAAKQTFDTEEKAKQWFEEQYPHKHLSFTGYEFDGNYHKNYVCSDNQEVGYINKYPDNEHSM